jgi:hypothetical protein
MCSFTMLQLSWIPSAGSDLLDQLLDYKLLNSCFSFKSVMNELLCGSFFTEFFLRILVV